MKKKSFVLSWGRKMFFGIGWALTCVVALNYFQSMLFPQSVTGWLYYLTTFIGHYGLMISLAYFLLYCPVIAIFPSYYISRLWSIALLLTINLFIFFDSYLFSKYGYHLNSFMFDLLKQDYQAFGFNNIKLSILGVVLLVALIVLWVRGERLWRGMQARFSNPVRNWYLVAILICLIISHSMHVYSDAHGNKSLTSIANLFPLHFPLTSKSLLKDQGMLPHSPSNQVSGHKNFYYPGKDLNCSIKQPRNILMIVLDSLSNEDITEMSMPQLSHYRMHALSFDDHYSGSTEARYGLFSLLYSLPPVYAQAAYQGQKSPVFLDTLKKANFEASFFSTNGGSPIKDFLEKEEHINTFPNYLPSIDEMTELGPFFMHVYLNEKSTAENDEHIGRILEAFYQHGLNSNTIMIITGARGYPTVNRADQFKTPLFIIWPGMDKDIPEVRTSHYDVLPTLMKNELNCKNNFSDYSFGKSLFASDDNTYQFAGSDEHLEIIDFKKLALIIIDKNHDLEIKHLSTMTSAPEKLEVSELLNKLEKIQLFNRPR